MFLVYANETRKQFTTGMHFFSNIPDLILQLYIIGVFQLSYLPYRGQNGSRSMQED
jgi:hypothetical protein